MPRTENELICGSYINFEGFGRLVLSNEDIECVTTNEELDATIIELTKQCVALLTQREVYRDRERSPAGSGRDGASLKQRVRFRQGNCSRHQR